jgi:hypothetical protein
MYEHNNLGLISIVLLIPVVPAIVTWNARFCLPKPVQKRATKVPPIFSPIFQSCEHDDIYMSRTQIILLLLDATSNLSLYL